MQSDTIDVRTPDGTADAYLTRPDEDRRDPAVLLALLERSFTR